jgi:hypothetical protein
MGFSPDEHFNPLVVCLSRNLLPNYAMNETNIKPKRKRKPIPWESGYICAVATMLRQHGEAGMAEDALLQIGMRNIDPRKINDFDQEILRQHGLIPD